MMMELETGFNRHFDVYSGAYQYAEEMGWEIIIDEFADDHLSRLEPGAPLPYDGVIARATPMLAEQCARVGMPAVNVWLSSPVVDRLPGVFPDYAITGRLRAEHLLSRGVTRFHVLVADITAHRLEARAFVQVVEAAGFQAPVIWVPNDISGEVQNWREIERVMDDLIAGLAPPAGVFTGSEMVGRLLTQRCHNSGLKVPQDVAIICGHNESAYVEKPRPTLSSIDLGHERIGYEAARMLHAMFESRDLPSRHLLVPPAGVVARESTDFQVVEDAVVESALKFIADHYQQKIGPEDVAKAVGVQTRTLQNRFNKALGWPIATEIRRVRVERAKRALTDSDRLVADIAEEVGYPNPMRLYEVFRRELGVSPSEYRRQYQESTALE